MSVANKISYLVFVGEDGRIIGQLTATNVPGRKTIVMPAIVFIAMLSFLVSMAMLALCVATRILTRLSF